MANGLRVHTPHHPRSDGGAKSLLIVSNAVAFLKSSWVLSQVQYPIPGFDWSATRREDCHHSLAGLQAVVMLQAVVIVPGNVCQIGVEPFVSLCHTYRLLRGGLAEC
jgi:hypothetical protein